MYFLVDCSKKVTCTVSIFFWLKFVFIIKSYKELLVLLVCKMQILLVQPFCSVCSKIVVETVDIKILAVLI